MTEEEKLEERKLIKTRLIQIWLFCGLWWILQTFF